MRKANRVLLLAIVAFLLAVVTTFEARVTASEAQRFVQSGAVPVTMDPGLTLPFPGEEY